MAVYLARFIPVNDVERAVYFSHFSIPRLHLPLGGSARSLRAARFLSRQHRCRLYPSPPPPPQRCSNHALLYLQTPAIATLSAISPQHTCPSTVPPSHASYFLARPRSLSCQWPAAQHSSPSAPSSAFQAPPKLLLAALLKPFFLPARRLTPLGVVQAVVHALPRRATSGTLLGTLDSDDSPALFTVGKLHCWHCEGAG